MDNKEAVQEGRNAITAIAAYLGVDFRVLESALETACQKEMKP